MNASGASSDPDAMYRTQLRATMVGSDTEDELAIKELCFNETWGNHIGNPDLWASCWLHSDSCSLTGVLWDVGLFTWTGWTDIEAAVRPEVDARAHGSLTAMPFSHEDHQIAVCGDMAWARFVETNWHALDRERKQGFKVMEYRFLERREAAWKIVHLIFVPLETALQDRIQIPIDGSGHIEQILPAERIALANTGLTISAGRIRAVLPKWDRELQAVIARLRRSTGLAELTTGSVERAVFNRAIVREIPVMLGEDEHGGQRYCIVMIRDGRLFIGINDPARIDHQLARANVVYGLTDAQLRLAREIVAGSSLPAAAMKLGISVNTARTHRTRIFNKIGVSSQAALVRCLLSVGV